MKIIPQSVTRNIGRKILITKKNSPHIFFVGGVIGVVGSAVLACRATLKLEETLDVVHQDFTNLKALKLESKDGDTQYERQDYVQDLGYVYTKTIVNLGRLYGPSRAAFRRVS